ncbi:MAG: ATP-dependent 6-phosphofructokinase [Candidatus Thermoplasmatota archaeon]|nr:ATP-dependent 6-phosphofructokinase [Candidatus Thermoplasmatota archaeon]
MTGFKNEQIAVLTGGGDAPGLNAVIRGLTTKAILLGYDVLGLRDGWSGLLDDGESTPLDLDEVEDIHMIGGTILHTSRTNPYKVEGGVEQVKRNLKRFNCKYLVAIGGEDTLGVAAKLHNDEINVIGVPKTIDNDLSGTDYTFGFDTAITRAAEAIKNLHTTADSHHRVIVVEVMGRHAGWMTLEAGIAGGAHAILFPEEEFDIDELCKIIENREKKGKHYTVIATSEGAMPKGGELKFKDVRVDAFGHKILGGTAERLAKKLEEMTGKECRYVVLGHLQRAGSPTAFDINLGTRLGVHAAEMIDKGEFGMMAALHGTEVVSVPLETAVGTLKTVPKHRIEEAKIFYEL